MIAVLAALCLAGTPGFQGKTLLEQIVPKPTGANGYEEYLRAADILSDGDARMLITWRPGVSEETADDESPPKARELVKRLKTMSLLEIRREALRRYSQALVWVRQGNGKPVFDPRPNRDFSLELARFRDIGNLAVVAAYVYDSDGVSTRGTEVLLDALVMAEKIAPGRLMHLLIGADI